MTDNTKALDVEEHPEVCGAHDAKKAMRDALKIIELHHNHHAQKGTIGIPDGDGGFIEIDNGAEYGDSGLHDQTVSVISELRAGLTAPAEPVGWQTMEKAPEGCVTDDVGCRGNSEWFLGRIAPKYRNRGSSRYHVIHRRCWPNEDSWEDVYETHFSSDYFDAWKPIEYTSPPSDAARIAELEAALEKLMDRLKDKIDHYERYGPEFRLTTGEGVHPSSHIQDVLKGLLLSAEVGLKGQENGLSNYAAYTAKLKGDA